jgi:uncharacterized cofD-like protein
VFIAGLEHVLGDFEKVLEIVHDFMKVKGKCLPATIEKVQLYAELENGQIIVGEDEIDVPKEHDGSLRIKKVWLEPEAEAYKPVIQAIENADYIIVGPGDLYSSLVCCFLPKGIQEAMKKTKAKKIFIAPVMTKFGESDGFYLEDFVNEVEKYMGAKLDHVICNTTLPDEKRIRMYKMEEPLLMDVVRHRGKDDKRFIGVDLLKDEGAIVHDAHKLKDVLFKLLEI